MLTKYEWEGLNILQAVYRKNHLTRVLISFMLISALMFSITVPAFADSEPQSSARPVLDQHTAGKFLDDFFTAEEVQPYYPGAAVVIVKDGEVIAQEGYGYANVEEQLEVDPKSTVFRVASISKTFTAVAIMQLAEEGKLHVNDDIRKHLPDVEFHNPFQQPVTIAHLLTHQSGFEVRDPQNHDLHTDFERYVSIEDYVHKHMPSVVREPGTAYLYDNFAYLLLGLIVQNVSGQPFEDYMDDHIFGPLGMDSSGFVLEGKLLEQLATGYDAAGGALDPYTVTPTVMPQGGMLSTAEDMSKFMLAFLNEGTLASQELLSEQSVAEMSRYRSSIHEIMPNTTYGFEAAAQLPQAGSSKQVITKLGDLPGNSSMLLFIPEEEVGVFLTYNTQGVLRDLFYSQFMATFYPEYTVPVNFGEFEPYTAEQLAPLAGLYSDLRLAAIVSQVEVIGDGQLAITDALIGTRTLTQVDDNLFVDDLTQSYTAFAVDERRGTVYMKEPYLNPLGYARKGDAPVGYADVGADHPYAAYIWALQSIGHYPNDAQLNFHPQQPISRAEFTDYLLKISGIKAPPAEHFASPDIALHPIGHVLQLAYEIGIVSGDEDGLFRPSEPITRQEAAVMVWNIYSQLYPDELFADIELSGETADWAVPAVKMMVALGYHGPEVSVDEDGAANYRSEQLMTRQEAAAFFYQLLFQPSDQIVAGLMQQQQANEAPDVSDSNEAEGIAEAGSEEDPHETGDTPARDEAEQ